MIFVGIIVLIAVPYLCGTLETMVLRERNAGHLNIYVTGLLSLFAYFLFSILVSLKLDFTFEKMRLMFLAGPVLLSMTAIPVLIYKIKKGLVSGMPSVNRQMLWFVPTAVVLGAVAFLAYEPSYINDNTWEIVNTTLESGTIYEISSLTGKPLELALPIFTKIYVMPMFYAVMCKTFGFEMWLLAGLLMPVIFFALNISLIYSISGELMPAKAERRRALFMCIHLLLLIAGTYLPADGITATAGYALLREGYTGYALTYGVLVPFVLLLLLRKKYVHAFLSGITFLGLIPLDKFFFAVLGTPVRYYTQVNTAGKLAAFYLVSLMIMAVLVILKKDRCRAAVFACPSVLVCYCVVRLSDFIQAKRDRIIYFLGVGIVVLAACGFRPMEDAIPASNIRKENADLKACILEISKDKAVCLWGTEDIMSEARRISPKVELAYPRSVFASEMYGIEYDPITDEMDDMVMFVRNKIYEIDYLTISRKDSQIVDEAINLGVNCIIIPGDSVREDFELLLLEHGFSDKQVKYGYTVFLYDFRLTN